MERITVYTSVTYPTEDIVPAGEWSGTETLSLSRGWVELRNKPGNLQIRAGVQLTNDPRSPGTTVTAVGALQTTNGTGDPTGWVTLAAGSYRYWRPVYLVSLTLGTTLAFGNAGGVVQTAAS
jgi:hypothetical protein